MGQWGVTVLQADEDWDAGHTWATQNFEVDIDALNLSKSSFYRSLCVPAAAVAVKSALQKLISGLPPLPLCEPMSAGEVQGADCNTTLPLSISMALWIRLLCKIVLS